VWVRCRRRVNPSLPPDLEIGFVLRAEITTTPAASTATAAKPRSLTMLKHLLLQPLQPLICSEAVMLSPLLKVQLEARCALETGSAQGVETTTMQAGQNATDASSPNQKLQHHLHHHQEQQQRHIRLQRVEWDEQRIHFSYWVSSGWFGVPYTIRGV